MQAFLPTIQVCFKKLDLASKKSVKVPNAAPATDTHITVLSVDNGTQVYQNLPLTGWRNWRTIGNVAYAQHPTEEWYVKVDSLRVLASLIEERKSFEQLSLAICSQSTTAITLSPVCDEALISEFSHDLIYARLSRKNKRESDALIRVIKEVDLVNRVATIEELEGHCHSTYSMTWVELLTKFSVTKVEQPLQRIFHEIANSRQLDDKIYQVTATLDYSINRETLFFSAEGTHGVVDDILTQALHQLHLIDVDTRLGGPNVWNNRNHIDINVTIEQFFQLCDLGWFFAQWLTPQAAVPIAKPFFASSRQVLLSSGDTPKNCLLSFEYSIRNNQHCLTLSEACSISVHEHLCANSLPELAALVREWMLHNIQTIRISPEVNFFFNQEQQLVNTLLKM